MKKGFISMTIVYSFLLIFIFTLLAFLVLYTQKSRLVDSIVNESKEQIYNTDYSAITIPLSRDSKFDGVRYIKDCVTGNSVDDIDQWVEVKVMKDGENIALNKPVTSAGSGGGTLNNGSYVTDGDIDNITAGSNTSGSGFAYISPSASGNEECVKIDLQAKYDIDEIIVWHHYIDGRVYYNNITYTSSNGTTWKSVMNEATTEGINGKRVSAYTDVINGYIQSGLIGWYDGISNNGAGGNRLVTTWTNLASSTGNGTLVGGATWNSDSLALDGAGDGVSLADAFADLFKSSSTVQITVKRNETGVRDILFGNHNTSNSINFEVSADNQYRIYFGGGTVNTTVGTAPANQKYVVTFRVNKTSNMLEIYNNDTYDSYLSHTVFGTYDSSFNAAYIGRDYRTGTTCLNGNVYSVRIYNRALTSSEIRHNYLYDKTRFGL